MLGGTLLKVGNDARKFPSASVKPQRQPILDIPG
jgi:hypothetical protein